MRSMHRCDPELSMNPPLDPNNSEYPNTKENVVKYLEMVADREKAEELLGMMKISRATDDEVKESQKVCQLRTYLTILIIIIQLLFNSILDNDLSITGAGPMVCRLLT